jgi:hypothetical protein
MTTMKISLKQLKSIINETVSKNLSSSGIIGLVSESEQPVDWENMRLLLKMGKLRGSWLVIMTALEATGGDKEKALQLLKASVAKLESKMPTEKQDKPEEMASTEELSDFSKLL